VKELNDRQRLFVAEYLLDLNATQAAIRAGYSPKTAGRTGHENLKKPEIAAAIQEAFEARLERLEVSAERVVLEYARLAFSDLRQVVSWNEYGVSLRDSGSLSDEAAAAVQQVTETITRLEEGGTTIRRQVKLHDKLGALRDLGRHLGLFGKEGPSPVNVNVKVDARPRKAEEEFEELFEAIDEYRAQEIDAPRGGADPGEPVHPAPADG